MYDYLRLKSVFSTLIGTGVLAVAISIPASIAAADTLAVKAGAPAPVIWKLDDPVKVGGLETKVVGAPQVQAEQGAKALVFNGTSDGVFVPVNPVAGWAQFTIEVLIKPDGTGAEEQRFMHIQDKDEHRIMIETRVTKDRRWALDTFIFASKENSRPLLDVSLLHPTDQWHWVALVYDGKHMANYVNGVKELEGEVVVPPMQAGLMSIGVRQNLVYWYKGAIREVRFHPLALAPAALQRVEVK
jgi:hypothetical protein